MLKEQSFNVNKELDKLQSIACKENEGICNGCPCNVYSSIFGYECGIEKMQRTLYMIDETIKNRENIKE